MIKKADVYVQEFMEVFKENVEGKIHELTGLDAIKNMEKQKANEKEALITTVLLICQRLIMEINDIADMRHAKSVMAMEAIVKEQERKWTAIVRRLDIDKLPMLPSPDSFQIVWGQFKQMAKRR